MRMVFDACEDGQLISNENEKKRVSRVFPSKSDLGTLKRLVFCIHLSGL
jgi:hypothetical protein